MEIAIIGSCILIVCTVLIFFAIRQKRCVEFLLKNSFAIKNLQEINGKYSFLDIKNYNKEEYTYDNQKLFENISCQDYLIYQLQFKQYDFQKRIRDIEYNKEKYQAYYREISLIKRYGEYGLTDKKRNKKYLLELEGKLFNQRLLKPAIEFTVHISLYCSTMSGRVYAYKGQDFSSGQILALIKRLNDKNRGFYNDREIWDALCRVERGKVSNKMRFSIYQRDGYRCCICGRGEREDCLEIDHIKPISKGGKSTYDNLQTLCRSCNLRKGNINYGQF